MRLTTTLAAAAALAVSGFAANAGGVSEPIDEPIIVAPSAPATSSVNSTYVIIGVLAALVIAAAVSADD